MWAEVFSEEMKAQMDRARAQADAERAELERLLAEKIDEVAKLTGEHEAMIERLKAEHTEASAKLAAELERARAKHDETHADKQLLVERNAAHENAAQDLREQAEQATQRAHETQVCLVLVVSFALCVLFDSLLFVYLNAFDRLFRVGASGCAERPADGHDQRSRRRASADARTRGESGAGGERAT